MTQGTTRVSPATRMPATGSPLDSPSDVSCSQTHALDADYKRRGVAPPVWTSKPGDVKAKAGDDVAVRCDASGEPVPAIEWRRLTGACLLSFLRSRAFTSPSSLERRLFLDLFDSSSEEPTDHQEHQEPRRRDIRLSGSQRRRTSAHDALPRRHPAYESPPDLALR